MMNGKRQGAARARTKGAAAMVTAIAASAVAAWTSTARADFLTVFAGPGINPVGGSYQAPNFGDPLGAAVNDAGTAVVSVHRYTNPGVQDAGERGMRWDGSGAPPAELGNLGTGSNSFTNTNANAINRGGVSVGYATVFGAGGANHGWRAVRWDAAGNPTQLDALGTDANGVGTGVGLAVNATGTAVGFAASYTNLNNATGSRAVRWNGTGTTATVLGDIGVDAGGSTFARAY